MRIPFLVGILNVTPDSFSDGGKFLRREEALQQGWALFDAGADYVELGGDSSRPGSVCVGIETEWERIGELIPELVRHGKVAVDTHQAEVAKRALESGTSMINDVSGASDPRLPEIVKSFGAKLVIMYSSSGKAHEFAEPEGEIGKCVHEFFQSKIKALDFGRENLLLDTGMGAFLSKDPEASKIILSKYPDFSRYEHPLYLGVSRKGFLGAGLSMEEKDRRSAQIGVEIWQELKNKVPLYLRVHDVKGQRSVLEKGAV